MTRIEALRIRTNLEIAVQSLDDQTALTMKTFYPTFTDIVGQTVEMGFKFSYENELYKTVQPKMTIMKHYPPVKGTESLYARIDETHDGSEQDPIPYNGNMILEQGKYYTQNSVTYLCIRNTEIEVHHTLADLVGLYVEIVN